MARTPVIFAITDLETTGLVNADFVQLASVIHVEGDYENVQIYTAYAKPNQPIHADAERVHGISEARVSNCRTSREVSSSWLEALTTFAEYEKKEVVLVGHNLLRFDLPILTQHTGVLPYRMIDTLNLSRRIDTQSPCHKLGYLVGERHKLHPTLANSAHDALADCYMVGLLLKKYLQYADCEALIEWSKPNRRKHG